MHKNVAIISTEVNVPLYSDLVLVTFCVNYAVILKNKVFNIDRYAIYLKRKVIA